MKIVTTFILIIIVHLTGYGQGDYVNWYKDVKIRWSHFKGKTDVRSPFAAMSAVGIHYKYNSWSNGKVYKVRFEINARFDKTKSWSKRSLQTASILKHEQLHFDIAEVVSREFKKVAERTNYSKNYKSEIIRIFHRYTRYLQKLQQKYDLQTKHSNNKAKQKEWERLIHQELLK